MQMLLHSICLPLKKAPDVIICRATPPWFGGGYIRFGLKLVTVSTSTGTQGAVSIRKTVLPGMAIPMLKIRRPNGRLIFNMEIAIRR